MKALIQISVLKFWSRIKSAVYSSSQKLKIITDMYELGRKNFWSNTSLHAILEIWISLVFSKHNSHTYQEKKNNFYPFIAFLFTSNQ